MKKTILFLLFVLALFLASAVLAQEVELDRPLEISLLGNDELLIVDGGGRDWTSRGGEIFIFDREGNEVWRYDGDLIFAHSAHVFADGLIVIADSGNDRVFAVSRDTGQIIWSSDYWGGESGRLSDGTHLDYPNEAVETSSGLILITDRNNNRIIEVDEKGGVFWQYRELERPHNASKLSDGNYLVSDSENNRVIMLSPAGEILWQFGGGDNPFVWPRDVKLLANGNFLITDTRNHRVLEVSRDKSVVWEYSENLYWPYEAERLESGNTLISDSQNGRVVEVTPAGEVVWELKNRSKQKFGSFTNGGFEQVAAGESTGWIKADLLAEGGGEFSLDSQITHSGKYSARLDYEGQGHIFWLQKAAVSPGKNYRFSGWVKSSLEEDKSWARYELWWENEEGGFVAEPLHSDKSKGETDWVRREWEGRAPESAVAVNIRALMTGGGTSWFDDTEWESIGGISKNLWYFLAGMTAVLVAYKIISLARVKLS